MNQAEFIEAIKIAVEDTAITDVKATLKYPLGKSPSKEKVALSKWFNSLSETDKTFV